MRTLRPSAAIAAAFAFAVAGGGAAHAQLPVPTVPLPDPVTTITSTVGGLVTGTTQQVTGTVEEVLSGSIGATLPTDTLDQLLGTTGTSAETGGGPTSGGATSGGPAPTGAVLDARPPKATVTLLSRLRRVGATGRLQLRISLDEPGIIAMRGTLQPGLRRHLPARLRRLPYSRRAVMIPATVLAYRQAGSLIVTISVSRTAQRTFNRARDARLDLRLLAADAAHNQAGARVLRHVGR
jgi:hypothetical protein